MSRIAVHHESQTPAQCGRQAPNRLTEESLANGHFRKRWRIVTAMAPWNNAIHTRPEAMTNRLGGSCEHIVVVARQRSASQEDLVSYRAERSARSLGVPDAPVSGIPNHAGAYALFDRPVLSSSPAATIGHCGNKPTAAPSRDAFTCSRACGPLAATFERKGESRASDYRASDNCCSAPLGPDVTRWLVAPIRDLGCDHGSTAGTLFSARVSKSYSSVPWAARRGSRIAEDVCTWPDSLRCVRPVALR